MGRRAGFTLLELLLAVTVLAMIMTIVYTAFASVVEGVETTRAKAAEMRVRQFLAHQFARNLTGAYIDPVRAADGLYYMEGLNEEGNGGPKDSLTFYSTATIMGAGAFPGDMKLVTIEVLDEESEDDFSLDRSERPADAPALSDTAGAPRMLQVVETPFSSPEIAPEGATSGLGPAGSTPEEASELVEAPSWTVPIQSLDIQYFDGEQWVEEWNSYDYQRLPWCIRIAINFPKTEEQLRLDEEAGFDPIEDPDFEMDIPLAAAGIGLLTQPGEVPRFDPFNEADGEGETPGDGDSDNDNDNDNEGGSGSNEGGRSGGEPEPEQQGGEPAQTGSER